MPSTGQSHGPAPDVDDSTAPKASGDCTIAGVIVAVLLIVGGALALRQHAETSVTSTSEGSDADFEHDPLSPEHAPPETVATNAMSMIFFWQPGRGRSGWEALNRAAQTDLLTGVLAKAAATEPNPLPRPVSDWAAWERTGDTVTAAGAGPHKANLSSPARAPEVASSITNSPKRLA